MRLETGTTAGLGCGWAFARCCLSSSAIIISEYHVRKISSKGSKIILEVCYFGSKIILEVCYFGSKIILEVCYFGPKIILERKTDPNAL